MSRYARNSLLAALLVYGLLWLLSSPNQLQQPSDTLTVRQVTTATIKPPTSPPETMTTKTQAQSVSLSAVATQESVSIKLSSLDVELPATLMPELDEAEPQTLVGQYQTVSRDDVVADMLTFRLDELDEKPTLLSRISAKLPQQLQRRGIRQARIILHVIIHENGRVEMRAIEKNAYPILNSMIAELVRQARFSSPIRNGKSVKAEFLWPIIIKA